MRLSGRSLGVLEISTAAPITGVSVILRHEGLHRAFGRLERVEKGRARQNRLIYLTCRSDHCEADAEQDGEPDALCIEKDLSLSGSRNEWKGWWADAAFQPNVALIRNEERQQDNATRCRPSDRIICIHL